jgi:hypothetical protein
MPKRKPTKPATKGVRVWVWSWHPRMTSEANQKPTTATSSRRAMGRAGHEQLH